MMHKLSIMTILIALISAPASADWLINNSDSTVSLVSTKANAVAEVLHFQKLDGRVEQSGNARLHIELDSIATGIEIRDGRMRELLFDTAKFPRATVTMRVDMEKLQAQKPGTSELLETKGMLSLHGTESEITLSLRITRLSDNAILVASEKPVIVNAGSVGLASGVEALREIAGLPSISPAVPVSFILRFEKES